MAPVYGAVDADVDVESLINRGVELKRLRRHREAAEAFERAVSIDRDRAEAWRHIGGLEMIFGRWEEAVEAFSRALEIDPEIAVTKQRKQAALRIIQAEAGRRERHEKAAAQRREWEETFEARLDVRQRRVADYLQRKETYNEAAHLLEDGRYEDAVDLFAQVTKEVPDHFRAWSKQGVALRETGRFEEALAAHRRALELNPDYAIARSDKQITLNKYRQWERERAKPPIILSKTEEDMLVMGATYSDNPAIALPAILHEMRRILPSDLQPYGEAASLLFEEEPGKASANAARALAEAPHDQILRLLRLSADQKRYWLEEVPALVSDNKAYRYYALLMSVKEHQETGRTRVSPRTGRKIEFPGDGRLQDPEWVWHLKAQHRQNYKIE